MEHYIKIILVDNSDNIHLKIIKKRLETTLKNIGIMSSIISCNEHIFETVKTQNEDFSYICCSLENTSGEFQNSFARGLSTTVKKDCLFYYASDANLEKFIVNEEFTDKEVEETLKRIERKVQENKTIYQMPASAEADGSQTTESNMAVQKHLQQKRNKEKEEQAMSSLLTTTVTDKEIEHTKPVTDTGIADETIHEARKNTANGQPLISKNEGSNKKILPAENNNNSLSNAGIASNNDSFADLNNTHGSTLSTPALPLEDGAEELIPIKKLNELFQAGLKQPSEELEKLLYMFETQQSLRLNKFNQTKQSKATLLDLIEDMTNNREKYENVISSVDRENLTVVKNDKTVEYTAIIENLAQCVQEIDIAVLLNQIQSLYKYFEPLSYIASQAGQLIKVKNEICKISETIDLPAIPVINYNEELQKNKDKLASISSLYNTMQEEGNTIYSLTMALKELHEQVLENKVIMQKAQQNSVIPSEPNNTIHVANTENEPFAEGQSKDTTDDNNTTEDSGNTGHNIYEQGTLLTPALSNANEPTSISQQSEKKLSPAERLQALKGTPLPGDVNKSWEQDGQTNQYACDLAAELTHSITLTNDKKGKNSFFNRRRSE